VTSGSENQAGIENETVECIADAGRVTATTHIRVECHLELASANMSDTYRSWVRPHHLTGLVDHCEKVATVYGLAGK
jgi:hypothetical protein